MTKADLIEKMAKDAGISKAAAGEALDSLMDGIKKSLKKRGQGYTCRLRHVLCFEEEGPQRQEPAHG